jgi:hypothetical protein
LRSRTPLQAISMDASAGDLRRFYGNFPAMQKLPDELERLYGLARAARLDLLRGEYRLERRGRGLASYRVTLPMRGTYPQIREFVGSSLKQMPYAALDGLRFERRKVGDGQVEAQVRLIVYFRTED